MNFWRIGSNFINPAHIVRCEYAPARVGYDDDDKEFPVEAKLVIVLSELRRQDIEKYDGDIITTITLNKQISITGAQAERMVEWLSIPADFPADEPTTAELAAATAGVLRIERLVTQGNGPGRM